VELYGMLAGSVPGGPIDSMTSRRISLQFAQ